MQTRRHGDSDGKLRVQFGTGWGAADGWLNFDASPTLVVERLPIIGRFVRLNAQRFPANVRFGDIVKGLPVPPGSAEAIYASHVLEHLSYDDFWVALRNTYDMLAPGGVFRLIVPDLHGRAVRYAAGASAGDPEAASKFLLETGLGRQRRPKTVLQMLKRAFGNADHLWMWDEPSITTALAKTGFVDIRRCAFGDAADPAFSAVEDYGRFVDAGTTDVEVAIEARRPSEDAGSSPQSRRPDAAG